MKRILVLAVLAVVLVIALTACTEEEFDSVLSYFDLSCENSHGLSIHCNNKATYERSPEYWRAIYITTPEPVAQPVSPLAAPVGNSEVCHPTGELIDGTVVDFDWNCK